MLTANLDYASGQDQPRVSRIAVISLVVAYTLGCPLVVHWIVWDLLARLLAGMLNVQNVVQRPVIHDCVLLFPSVIAAIGGATALFAIQKSAGRLRGRRAALGAIYVAAFWIGIYAFFCYEFSSVTNFSA
jgi:hypothetical protein